MGVGFAQRSNKVEQFRRGFAELAHDGFAGLLDLPTPFAIPLDGIGWIDPRASRSRGQHAFDRFAQARQFAPRQTLRVLGVAVFITPEAFFRVFLEKIG
jgi:hypothetical protein